MKLPFLLQCGECSAKIKITKESLIGKKVRCPKCQAAIAVVPPAADPPPSRAPKARPQRKASPKRRKPAPRRAPPPPDDVLVDDFEDDFGDDYGDDYGDEYGFDAGFGGGLPGDPATAARGAHSPSAASAKKSPSGRPKWLIPVILGGAGFFILAIGLVVVVVMMSGDDSGDSLADGGGGGGGGGLFGGGGTAESEREIPGYGDDLAAAIRVAHSDLDRGNTEIFASRMFPPSAVTILKAEEQWPATLESLAAGTPAADAMSSDLAQLESLQPEINGETATFTLDRIVIQPGRSGSESFQDETRTIRFSLVAGHWRFFDNSAGYSSDVAASLQRNQ